MQTTSANALIPHLEDRGVVISASARKARVKKKQAIVEAEIEFLVLGSDGRVEITLPIRTVSEANNFQPWRIKHARHQKQKWWVELAFSKPECQLIKLPCKITLIRYAPKSLDKWDNLPISFKYILDRICAEITGDFRPGRADNTDQIDVKYEQVKSKQYYVMIVLEF